MEDSDKGENEEMVDDLSESEEDETDEGEDADEKITAMNILEDDR